MKPLQHVTILDLSRVLACPFASMIMAELGATVIKIEEPGRGDETRTFEPFVERNGGSESAYYFACNRGKQSVTVNLRAKEGQQIIRDLARGADVFLENFPVGTLTRYDLDYPAIRAVNARIVYVSCTGFGQTGPFAHRRGYDTIFQAMGGIMSLTGERGGAPVKPGLPVADLGSGLWAAIAMLAALQGRAATGQGCHVDFSMLDGQIALLTLAAARYFALGEVPPRLGTEHPGRVPSASFQCVDGQLPAHHGERPALAAALPRARARALGRGGRAAGQQRTRAPPRRGDGAARPPPSPGDRATSSAPRSTPPACRRARSGRSMKS